MRMHVRLIAGLGLAVVILSGCASPTRVGSMIPEAKADQAASSNSPLYRGISLTDVGGGEETDPMWTSEVGSKEFRESLVRTLQLQNFISIANDAPFQLKAFIVEVKHPIAGFSLTVDSFVRYTLVRSKDSNIIFDDVLQGTFTATTGDAFVAVERLRLAQEGAMRANISALLDRLHTTVIRE
jgi:hypothetical protein